MEPVVNIDPITWIYDTDGNDALVGTGADDYFRVHLGTDTVDGDSGTDTLVFDYSASSRNQHMAATANGLGSFNGSVSDEYNNGSGWSANFYNVELFDVRTGSGSDTINLGSVNTDLHISSGAGDDFVVTGNGNQTISTGEGDDYVVTGSGHNVLDFGTGNNGWSTDASAATTDISVNFVTSSYSGPDTVTGSFSYSGHYYTGSGNDTIVSGTGGYSESFDTGSGDDSVTVHRGYDRVAGGAGSDTLVIDHSGSNRNQTMTVTGNAADGFSGVETDNYYDPLGWATNFSGIETFDVTTGTGDDTINLGSVDTDLHVTTGAGSDYVATGTGINVLDFGTGTNGWSANYSTATENISVNFRDHTYSGRGSATGDFSYSDYFYTGSGNDTIVSGTGGYSESFDTGAGDDSVTVHRGYDRVAGGAGSDTLVIDHSGSNRNQTMNVTGNATDGFSGTEADNYYDPLGWATNFSGIEKFDVTTGTGGDTINLGSVDTDLHISTGVGNDILTAGAGNDMLEGGSGINTLSASAGSDTLSYAHAATGVTFNLALQGAAQETGVSTDVATGFENLLGSVNSDTLTGNEYANSLVGLGGDDVLAAGAGDDALDGGAGNDTLDGGSGVNTLVGGDGIDTLSYAHSGSAVTFSLMLQGTAQQTGLSTDTASGFENLIGSVGGDILIGDQNANSLAGEDGGDLLNGGSGHDTLFGGAGDDTLIGGNGNDRITGGDGIDAVGYGDSGSAVTVRLAIINVAQATGGAGSDTFTDTIEDATGSAFNDSITGNTASNHLSGGAGNDSLSGGAGADTLDGGEGNDSLSGGTEADILRGGEGGDWLDGGSGADALTGGNGNDSYVVDNAGDAVDESGTDGTDRVYASVSYTLGTNVENLSLTGSADLDGTGNDLANSLVGNDGSNHLVGGSGNDSLSGGAGADTLQGGEGTGWLDGGVGADALVGGNGSDSYVVDNGGDTVDESGTDGTDRVYASVSYTLGTNVENLSLSGSADLDGTGNDLANSITGNTGSNHLAGGAGNDSLSGGAGVDTLDGGEGNDNLNGGTEADILQGGAGTDWLDGGLGGDAMAGGAGNDSYVVDSAGDAVDESATDGTDRVYASVSYTLGTNVENLSLTGSADLDGTGNDLANSLVGNGGSNHLVGGAGNDTVSGGAGADTLDGGEGTDVLTGSLGADIFQFTSIFDLGLGATSDRITDFSSAQGEKIDLSAVDVNSLAAGDQAFNWIEKAAFSHAAGELRCQLVGGVAVLQGDIDGNGTADFSLNIAGASSLYFSDFVL